MIIPIYFIVPHTFNIRVTDCQTGTQTCVKSNISQRRIKIQAQVEGNIDWNDIVFIKLRVKGSEEIVSVMVL